MSTTLKEHIAETITEELRLFAEVLVTDVPHLAERGVELGAVRVVVVEEPTTPLAESWPLILSAAKAGKRFAPGARRPSAAGGWREQLPERSIPSCRTASACGTSRPPIPSVGSR